MCHGKKTVFSLNDGRTERRRGSVTSNSKDASLAINYSDDAPRVILFSSRENRATEKRERVGKRVRAEGKIKLTKHDERTSGVKGTRCRRRRRFRRNTTPSCFCHHTRKFSEEGDPRNDLNDLSDLDHCLGPFGPGIQTKTHASIALFFFFTVLTHDTRKFSLNTEEIGVMEKKKKTENKKEVK